jgi:phosphoglycolate phosphatase-like HAD superfamily hydrolase
VCKSKGVILWDMDGTLISPLRESNESPHLNALKKNGFNPQGKNPSLIGSTDFEVISSLLSFYPSNESENVLEKCFKDLDDVSLSLYQSNSFSLCQGLPKALIRIKEFGWDNGILTGNTNIRMSKKLEIVKIANYFNKEFMFSCNINDTRENITERAKKILKSAGYSNSFIVGDTPRDISVAKKYDLKVVAVSTGAFSLEELEKFAPNLLIRNLEDDLEILLNFIISIS